MKRIIIFILALWITACKKDDLQHKTYTDIGSFSLLYPKDTAITVLQYDSVKITPVIQNQDFSKTSYSYEWKIFGGGNPEIQPTVISTEKDLKIKFNYAPGSYFLQFNIIDNSTGVKQISLHTVTSKAKFYEGWLVAANNGSKGSLSFIGMDYRLTLDVIEATNNKIYTDKAVAAVSGVFSGFSGDGLLRILYFTDKGMRQFDANTFAEIEDVNSMLSVPLTFTQTPWYDMDGVLGNQFLVNNGSLYAAVVPGSSIAETDMGTFSDRFPGSGNIFSYAFPTSNSARTMFYDNTARQFLNVAYRAREFNVNTVLDKSGVLGKKMIGADHASTSIGVYLCLMKDESSDKYYLHRVNFTTLSSATNSTFSSTDFAELPTLPEIDQMTAYAASSKYLQAYYATKNKIYKIDFSSKSVTRLYEFPAGSEIADMKMYKRTNRYYQFDELRAEHNMVLVTAVNNGSTGEIQYIKLDDLGNWNSAVPIQKVTGFGTIRNISYRSPR